MHARVSYGVPSSAFFLSFFVSFLLTWKNGKSMQDEDDKKLWVIEMSGGTTRCLTRCLAVAGCE